MMANDLAITLCSVLTTALSFLPSHAYGFLDAEHSPIEQIIQFGYPLEVHDVVTEDGYILQLHRIPHGVNNSAENEKPVVLFVPGLMCTAEIFTINGPSRSLPLLLADLGYDVWIGNQRGTAYSRKHINLDTSINSEAYWNFSNHEIGIYDVPNFINFALNTTKQENLYFVGYSEGTTVYFIMISELPEYNKKIRISIILAPVTYTSKNFFPVGRLFGGTVDINHLILADVFHYYGMFLESKLTRILWRTICQPTSPFDWLCEDILYFLFGFDSEQLNKDLLPQLIDVFPVGTSIKLLHHYWQNFRSGYFRQYDYGTNGNLLQYGQSEPPNYNISKTTAPVAIYCGANDYLSSITEATRLASEISNLAKFYIVPWRKFNHIDFIWGRDMYELLYKDIITLIQQY